MAQPEMSKEELLARHFEGSLSGADERKLVDLALSDSEVFDVLLVQGLAEGAGTSPRTQAANASEPAVTGWKSVFARIKWRPAFALAVCLAIAGFALWRWRQPSAVRKAVAEKSPVTSGKDNRAGARAEKPEPQMLARVLPAGATSETFRGLGADGAKRRETGIQLLTAPEVDVPYGSADGVSVGMRLEVARGGKKTGTVEIGAFIFRTHSRARIVEGEVHDGDQARLPAEARFDVLLQESEAALKEGKPTAALPLLRQAGELSVSGIDRRTRLLLRRAQLQQMQGELRTASQSAEAAANSLTDRTEPGIKAEVLESLGDIRLTTGRYKEAEEALRAASSVRATAATLNNLAIAVEQNGGLSEARELYEKALALPLVRAQDQAIIRANLERLRSK